MYLEISKPSKRNQPHRWVTHLHEEVFTCRNCNALVAASPLISGVQNRNHCPYCLWSRHVDHTQPGDRMSACKAVMQPIGLTVKPGRNKYGGFSPGELMLIHRCSECGKLSINRIAADDCSERLMELYQASLRLDTYTQSWLAESGIYLLQAEDSLLVEYQLWGNATVECC